MSEKTFDECLNNIDKYILNGLVIADVRTGECVFFNRAAKAYFDFRQYPSERRLRLTDLFGKENVNSFLADTNGGNTHIETDAGRTLFVLFRNLGEYLVLNIAYDSAYDVLKTENKNLVLLNKQLRDIYEIYNRDSIYIANQNGVIEYAGDASERHCGVPYQEIIGKSMYDLEREKISYPSVTMKVMESQKAEIVMQKTSIGVELCTIGIPVFDDEGNLNNVISISRDFAKEIEIAQNIIEADKIINHKLSVDTDNRRKPIITCSENILQLMSQMERAALTNATVLIHGETGTGKSLFARYIHTSSNRMKKPFISVNCGAMPENLIESELFGYVKGAFTGADKDGKAGLIEMAQSGTVFLDEIGELPLPQQVKLLHVLQEREITRVGGTEPLKLNVRVIAATNKDLMAMVREGSFREDLYYRLNVISFHIPRLEERCQDIPLLVRHFLYQYNQDNNTNKEISEMALKHMMKYEWPGNIRELENTIEKLCVITDHDIISPGDLPPDIYADGTDNEGTDIIVKDVMNMKNAVEDVEKKLIRLAMKRCGSNHQKIAELLGVDRSTITRKINHYGIK